MDESEDTEKSWEAIVKGTHPDIVAFKQANKPQQPKRSECRELRTKNGLLPADYVSTIQKSFSICHGNIFIHLKNREILMSIYWRVVQSSGTSLQRNLYFDVCQTDSADTVNCIQDAPNGLQKGKKKTKKKGKRKLMSLIFHGGPASIK